MTKPATQLLGLRGSLLAHTNLPNICIIGIICHFGVCTSVVTTCLQSREYVTRLGHIKRCSTRAGLMQKSSPGATQPCTPLFPLQFGCNQQVKSNESLYGVTGFASLSRGSSSASFPLEKDESRDNFCAPGPLLQINPCRKRSLQKYLSDGF